MDVLPDRLESWLDDWSVKGVLSEDKVQDES